MSPLPQIRKGRFLNLMFADTEDPSVSNAATLPQVQEALRFAAGIPGGGVLVVNCHAGVCRSGAMALAILAQRDGLGDPGRLRREIFRIRPQTNPNLLVSVLADQVLGASGRLAALALEISEAELVRRYGMDLRRKLPTPSVSGLDDTLGRRHS